MTAIPATPRRMRRAAYRCITEWLTLAALVLGGGWAIVKVWNLRMGV